MLVSVGVLEFLDKRGKAANCLSKNIEKWLGLYLTMEI